MCHDLDGVPPIPPVAGAAIDGQRIELEAADGNRFLAFDAGADDSPTRAGMVILPDVRGLHRFYEELALRFAERGIDAVATDYFGRTARSSDRGDHFTARAHVEQTRYETLMLDVNAARDHLVARGTEAVFSIGFCFGGRLAFLTGTRPELGLSGVIGFYGPVVGPGLSGAPAPLDVVGEIDAPVLGLFGGADQGIPQESINAFGKALSGAGVDNELVSYPGAPHSFFDRKATEFADAADDAWRRVVEFVDRHTPTS